MQCNVQTGAKWAAAIILATAFITTSLPADLIVTQLANEGVILSDGGTTQVIVDGLVDEPFSVYGGLPDDIATLYFAAAGPFSGIDLALASHQHHDHNQPASACKFLQKSTGTVFISSDQVIDLMREKCRDFTLNSPRVRTIDPQYDAPVVIEEDGVTVTVFLLSHGVGKYASLKNFGHLVEIGGMRVLHIGDAEMDAEDFARAGVDKMDIDVALIPFWYFRPGPGTDDVVGNYLDAPYKIAVHIPPSEMAEVKEYLNAEFPRVLILENAIDQARFSSEAPPPP